VDDDIDFGDAGGGDAFGEGCAEGFKAGASGAGGSGNGTVIEKNHFAAEVAEPLGKLAKSAFSGGSAAGRELKPIYKNDRLGEDRECEQG